MDQPKLLDLVRRKCRLKHYRFRTEGAYVGWIKRYVRYHGITHPRDLGDNAVEQFLSDLATNRSVSASTQNQALDAVLQCLTGKYRLMGYFLYGSGLRQKECLALRVKEPLSPTR